MKIKQIFVVGALLLASGWGLAQAAPAAGERAGTVKLVKGDVRVAGVQGERPLLPGDPVAVADRLITGADGSASVVLRDGTTLVVGPRSRLDLSAFSFDASTDNGSLLVSLAQGSLRMITGLIAKVNPSAVSVTTKTATIGVRGTDFIVQADD